jgi:hypothetical protein
MSDWSVGLTQQEAIARGVIVERVSARHHVPERADHDHRHSRTAMLLRRLAERLDPTVEHRPATGPGELRVVPTPHAGSPRPWSAARRAPHRHS